MDSDQSRLVLILRIQSFFFDAMLEGWAGEGKKIAIAGFPGYKAFAFREGDFYLLDSYCVRPRVRKSAGTTTIWFRDEPVWFMSYSGFYDINAVPFLKRALKWAYLGKEFFGGRGPHVFQGGSYLYMNRPNPNDFSSFSGREEIFNIGSQVSLGYHEYHGLLLI